jgi:hypothetical protein
MFAERSRANEPHVETSQLETSALGGLSTGATRLRGPAVDAVDFDLHLLALGSVRGVGVHALRTLIDTCGGDLSQVWHEDTATLGDWLARGRVKEARRPI